MTVDEGADRPLASPLPATAPLRPSLLRILALRPHPRERTPDEVTAACTNRDAK